MLKHTLYIFFSFMAFFPASGFPQAGIAESGFLKSSADHVIQLYINSVKEDLRLYSGTEFTSAYRSSAGFPFFQFSEPQQGNIYYDGIYYPGVLLSYDLINDQVVFITPVKKLKVVLVAAKVGWFSIKDHLFLNLTEDDGLTGFPGTGIYQLLFDGDVTVLGKSKKILYQPSRADETAGFIQTNVFYIRKNSSYFLINNKRSLVNAFKNYKPEIIKFIQRENVSFKKDPGQAILRVVEYYSKNK